MSGRGAPVLFMLDEFGSCLGRLEEIIKALGAARCEVFFE
jgi:type IV secretory pathway TraG/TraD family ATPase VirD4